MTVESMFIDTSKRYPLNTVAPRRRQGGAVLIVSLLFLAALTLIGISAMRGTALQEKMAGNTVQHNVAFQRAEAALNAGLNDLLTNTPNISNYDGTLPTYDAFNNTSPDPFTSATWTSANKVNGDSSMQWYAELLDPDRVVRPERGCTASQQGCTIRVFRITARGKSGNAQVVLRGIVGRE